MRISRRAQREMSDEFSKSRSAEDRDILHDKLLEYMKFDPETIAAELAYGFLTDDQVQDMLNLILEVEEEAIPDSFKF